MQRRSCLVMRVLRKPGNYLRNQAWKNLAAAVLCIMVFGVILLFVASEVSAFRLSLGFYEAVLLLISLAPLAAFYYYLGKFRIYSGGLEGENRVAKFLASSLGNDYYLINSASFTNGHGDIDHIVLGPNGVFVVETKNWSGKITCHGDNWSRQNRHKNSGFTSPSMQVKKNASIVRKAIETSAALIPLRIWVEGIVVIANNHADLQLNYPTVPILKLYELANFIRSQGNPGNYSRQQLELIAKQLLNHAQ